MKLDKIKIGNLFIQSIIHRELIIIKVIYVDEESFKTQRLDNPKSILSRNISTLDDFSKQWRLLGNCPEYLK